ncbi:arginine deiminase [Vagococcus intermedius]|uniref:Arginine deiminase n=1 Tax=Vagococcus intermedius TaxID=2991418 RepID=A0AAF0CWH0_9ENTE|nr:arginine deiminase [Vagococcus intermedius]WEG73972.1 arginine deiminase [Vagococcus intermedius]WEG76052.1 arginine deiminase [Vagococcus intermedius]
MTQPINVFSEIGKLKTVLLHRPGKELENLMPDYLDDLLFDDIPYLPQAQKEHDAFADLLRKKGVEVVYLEDLAAEAISEPDVRSSFIKDYLEEANIKGTGLTRMIQAKLDAIRTNRELIDVTMAGIPKSDLEELKSKSLTDMIESDYPFAIDPMPNLYFTRDPFATLGTGVSINKMYSVTRRRETLYAKYIFTYHPRFKDSNIPMLYDRHDSTRIEGGDELVLSKDLLALGMSQRTDVASIEKLAKNIFEQKIGFKRLLAFDIGSKRKFMHLDTVFTMLDYDKFSIHPEIEGDLTVYSISETVDGKIEIIKECDSLEAILNKYLEIDTVKLIRCGGNDPMAAAREQWNDGSNTLAIAPGEVIVYDRNPVTNKALEEAGVTLNYIAGSELVRGRGGPRCMSMPLVREDI